MDLVKEIKKVFPSIDIELQSSSSSEILLRTNFSSENETLTFVKLYEDLTNTKYLRKRYNKVGERKIFSKLWICHHSKHGKEKSSSRNADCKATISVEIKKITPNTSRRDKYIKRNPPLPCVIKVATTHSHNLVSPDRLKQLRVKNEVRDEYFSLFNDGMSPPQAQWLFVEKLSEKGLGVNEMAKSSINPTARQVRHLYDTWRRENLGSALKSLDKLLEKQETYKHKVREGSEAKYNSSEPFIVKLKCEAGPSSPASSASAPDNDFDMKTDVIENKANRHCEERTSSSSESSPLPSPRIKRRGTARSCSNQAIAPITSPRTAKKLTTEQCTQFEKEKSQLEMKVLREKLKFYKKLNAIFEIEADARKFINYLDKYV